MKLLGIFLDDEHFPKDVTWVTYEKEHRKVLLDGTVCTIIPRAADFFFFVSITNKLDFKDFIISFDHDIQSYNYLGDEITGFDCLKFLVDRLLDLEVSVDELPALYFHTQNPVGKKNMESYWNNFVDCVKKGYSPLPGKQAEMILTDVELKDYILGGFRG